MMRNTNQPYSILALLLISTHLFGCAEADVGTEAESAATATEELSLVDTNGSTKAIDWPGTSCGYHLKVEQAWTTPDKPYFVSTYSDWTFTDQNGKIHSFPRGVSQYITAITPPNGPPIPPQTIAMTGAASDNAELKLTAGEGTCSLELRTSIYPKYKVLSVLYAPPGQKSNVDYSKSKIIGARNSASEALSKSFGIATNYAVDLTLLDGIPIGGGWREVLEDKNSVALLRNTGPAITPIIVYGPESLVDGIDHDYDEIVLWLNPVVTFVENGTNKGTWNYSCDPRDKAYNGCHFERVRVGELKGAHPMRAEIATALDRTWAGPAGALASADYEQILKTDPFAKGPQTPSTTRFDLQGETAIDYVWKQDGYPLQAALTSTVGRTATSVYSSPLQEYHVGFSFLTNGKMTPASNWLWVDRPTNESNGAVGQVATLNLATPQPAYSGGNHVRVYKDNVYGTFMFAVVY